MFILLILLLMVFKTSCRGHSHQAGERGREGIPPPPTSESNKIQQFLFLFQSAFYNCSLIMQAKDFIILTMYAAMLRQFTAVLHYLQPHRGYTSLFVEPSEKARYLLLDLLKRFLLWTLRKKTTMNDSINVRFQAGS